LGTVQPREFAARVVAYVLVLPLSLLMMLGVFRVIGGLKNAEHRTDAVLALLALLGALLPSPDPPGGSLTTC
jgi:hypothetical protein